MAASWQECVCYLTSTSSASPKSFIPQLCTNICKSEEVILSGDEETESFIAPFIALASHNIGFNISKCQSPISYILNASKVLLKYCLKELKQKKSSGILSKKQLVSIIEGLCKGHGCLIRADVVAFTALLKCATIPQKLESLCAEEKEREDAPFHNGIFLQSLQMAFTEREEESSKERSNVDKMYPLTITERRDTKSQFSNHNVGILRELGGGQLLLDLCLDLPNLSKINKMHGLNLEKESKVSLGTVTNMTLSDAPKLTSASLQDLSSEMSIICSVISLPILEPLTFKRLNKVAVLALCCIDAALTVASGNFIPGDNIASTKQPKTVKGIMKATKPVKVDEEALEKAIESVVDTSLNIYDTICHVIGESSRAGGPTLQNLTLMTVYSIERGIMPVFGIDNKSSKSKDLASVKLKCVQGANIYVVSLASKGLVLLASLMEELKVEWHETDTQVEVKDLELTIQYSGLQRVKLLLKDIPLIEVMLKQFSFLYKKAYSLHTPQITASKPKAKSDKSPTSSSSDDADSEYISYSDDSSEDEESLLGRWFECTLQCPEMAATPTSTCEKESKDEEKKEDTSKDNAVKGTLTYLAQATNTLQFVVKHLLMNNVHDVQQYVRVSLNVDQMTDLAGILTELDSNTNKLKNVRGFDELCITVDEAFHLLLVEELLPEHLQDLLLDSLNLSPNSEGPWLLRINSTCLGVLARVVLARQQKAFKTNHGNMDIQECTNMWSRLIDTLEKNAVEDSEQNVCQDLNVEHLQLLLFVFHNLSYEKRKEILERCVQATLTISQSPNVIHKTPMALSRLLLLQDYFLHHFTSPPKELFAQVQRNLFRSRNAICSVNEEEPMAEVMFFTFPGQEEVNYQHACLKYHTVNGKSVKASEVLVMMPRFYDIRSSTPADDYKQLDDKACEILLQVNIDGSTYNDYYYAIINLMKAGRNCDQLYHTGDTSLEPLDAAFTRHCFGLCWRLLNSLPPSVSYLASLNEDTPTFKDLDTQMSVMLCNLEWMARLSSPVNDEYLTCLKKWMTVQGLSDVECQDSLDRITKICSSVHSSVVIAKNYLQEISKSHNLTDDVTDVSQLPSVFCMMLLDCTVSKTHIALTKLFGNTDEDPDLTNIMQTGKELILSIINLIPIYQRFSRYYILHSAVGDHKRNKKLTEDQRRQLSKEALLAYANVVQIGCMRLPKQTSLSMAVISGLPSGVQNAIEKWNSTLLSQFPSTFSLRDNEDGGISMAVETFLDLLVNAQMSAMVASSPFDMAPGLKHTLLSLVQLAADLVMWCPKEEGSIHSLYAKELTSTFSPLLVDATTEYIHETASGVLERVVGPADDEAFARNIHFYVLLNCQRLLTEQTVADQENAFIGEDILLDCLKYIESLMERPSGRSLLEQFYTNGEQLVQIILISASSNVSLTYVNRTLKMAVRILQLAEKHPTDSTIRSLGRSLSFLETCEPQQLENWLRRIVIGIEADCENTGKMADNRLLLQAFASHLVKESSLVGESSCLCLLDALLPIGDQLLSMTSSKTACAGAKLGDVIHAASILASVDQGKGHSKLCKAAIGWLDTCKCCLEKEDTISKPDGVKESSTMELAGPLLSYLAEMILALKYVLEQDTPSSPLAATQGTSSDVVVQDLETEWIDDIAGDEEESGGEESDEDSLCNKLCTFTITQKDFMNQHWYHCHTCKMNDGVGVCTICAKVCHKDHDVSYAKYGSFFCDCGAKEDGSCQSLVKRTPSSAKEGNSSSVHAFANGQDLDECEEVESLRREKKTSSYSQTTSAGLASELLTGSSEDTGQDEASTPTKAIQALAKQIEKHTDVLVKQLEESSLNSIVIQLLKLLMGPVIESAGPSSHTVGAAQLVSKALEDLHSLDKNVETTEQLMVPTLGSQEGAFENVRMTFSGEQGQAIRQLIGAHVLRRVAMCCLASPKGRRQHLAVSHEKGKITVLQLSALLKQADSSKRKLTLTRLATAQVPFTVLSITGNPCNEDFLAVCGLKDCHVLTLSSSGSVVDHLALHPQLETGNFIIKAIWLPGSQTELAVVTADFVKIYDLSKDALSPIFYFVLPSGKIRDASFVFHDTSRNMVLMSSAGHIYHQPMDDDSSATGGPFYLTNTIPVQHSDLDDTNGQVAGGGVSVYYSHNLQVMLFSYTQGKTFMAPWVPGQKEIKKLFPINFKSGNGGNKNSQAALYQWNEVPQHPGLVCCMTHTNGIPVVLMIKPDQVLIQEIKAASSKSKTQDMVAIRHSVNSSDQQRTTMILLCEDGSLRIYMANAEHTGYWMAPSFQPARPLAILRPVKKKKICKTRTKSTSVHLPIDFFEHCQVLNDVEFGGADILHVYNAQQAKHRLMTAGMYIASTKPSGFTIEVTNTNPGLVMVGVRVLVGCHPLEKVPSYVEVFGRVFPFTLTRNRWFDFPFTREESLTADKKLSIFFGQSADPSGVSMVDSIKVYAKTKEVFGWPDDPHEEYNSSSTTGAAATSNVVQEKEMIVCATPASPFDKLVVHLVEILDGSFSAFSTKNEETRQSALDLATSLMTCSAPTCIQNQAKSLLATLHPSKLSFHNHKDQAQLNQITQYLQEYSSAKEEEKQIKLDAEIFQRLVVSGRSVALSRPANLCKFASLSSSQSDVSKPHEEQNNQFASVLIDVFWRLNSLRPPVQSIAPLSATGLQDVESTVTALVDIIHAFSISDSSQVPLAVKLYVEMLLCQDAAISFACKQALIRVLHPLQKRHSKDGPTPPRCETPSAERNTPEEDDGDDDEAEGERSDSGQEEQSTTSRAEGPSHAASASSSAQLPSASSAASRSSQLESLLLGAAGNLPAVLDLPQDADDEAMMELAIALSLQEQSVGSAGLQLQGLSQGQISLALEGGNSSDTTTSAPGSEDEYEVPPGSAQGSSAGHSAPRSPIPPGISQQGRDSESGGSADSIAVEPSSSIATTSIDGDQPASDHEPRGVGSHSSDDHQGSGQVEESAYDHDIRHSLQLMLIEQLLSHLPNLKDVGGVRAIPFMQVLLMLCSDLEDNDKDIAALEAVLEKCLTELELDQKNYQEMAHRTKHHEVQLIIMRFLSVLMSKTKSSAKVSSEASSMVCSRTANILCRVGIAQHCLEVLKCLLAHWKKMAKKEEEDSVSVSGSLLKPQPASPPPDMSPFFLRQYVKGHAGDVFESYPQLLTEMVLRLPYQVKKVADANDDSKAPEFNEEWMYILCEYMMVQQTPFVRRQVRKLLLFLCGSKDSYRQERDLHALDFHSKAVRELSTQGGFDPDSSRNPPIVLSYDALITMIEHLKACSEIASSRISNWQAYCIQDKSALSFLLRASFLFEEGVAPLILQLLSYAICGGKSQTQASSPHKKKDKDKDRDKEKDKDKDRDRDKDKDKEKAAAEVSEKSEAVASSLVQQLHEFVDMDILRQFVQNFLLESNSTAVRWQAHELLYKVHKYSTPNQQDKLSDMMWKIWPELPGYGRRAAQFVDLLGFFTIKSASKSTKFEVYCERAVQLLKTQNSILENHPNSNVYRMLAGFVEFDGYYLESDPCLVCNNPEVPFQSLKLSAIKADFRFTTTSQLVKLINSHTISRITLKIADMKRQKMVRTITFYYNNRTVQSVVELKNKRPLWHKAKKCHLTPGQTELKVDFPLPIVACNLMIEYSDFYENFQASSETLQCPRCSASVPANPGVCSNCGENVYQCHKCRSINYDERDPFLCNACGFCKYAKFDYNLTARSCCAVDPIENEEDRKKAVASINSSLERADRVYRQLSSHRTPLDLLLTRIVEHGDTEVVKQQQQQQQQQAGTGQPQTPGLYSSVVQSGTSSSSSVNKAIQSLAHRYCVECKASFDELSKIIQKVLASRKELLEYDCRVRELPLGRSISQSDESSAATVPRSLSLLPSSSTVPGKCYGCASAATEHCVTLLRALAMNPGTRQRLVEQGLIRELVDFNLHQGTAQMRADVRHLLCLLTKNNEDATDELNQILVQRVISALEGHRSNPTMVSGIGPEMLLLSNTVEMEDLCWEKRIRCVMRIFMMSVETQSPLVMESITLSCLKILLKLVKPPAPTSKKNKGKDWESLGTIQGTSKVHVNTKQWLAKEEGSLFRDWKQQAMKKAVGSKKAEDESKEEARKRYLMEKYGYRWRMAVESKKQEKPSEATTDDDWLRQVLFTPSSRAARQIACTIVESLCQVPSRRRQMLDLLTSFLGEVSSAGENASEFFQLYQRLIQPSYLKFYLALQGALLQIGELITLEINRLSYLEQTTLSSDLSQGYALKMLTELLASFIEHENLKQKFKGKLVGTVLNGYLSLRRLVVQRTKLIDETQELLLELLEEMTTGTEVETRAFMAICVETLNRYDQDDLRTPVFIFERLCNLIYPEENDVGEFFMTLEKDPQQEDFLQGRMQGNPYSSNEPGLGPLMRDVKNKICTDCELVALLEDDSGMELLVNNKIISLDLPVKDVYKKIWCPEGEGEPMKIVYRMRGLLGDATEEFVENLNNSKEEDVDVEEVYRMASVMSVCGGLEAMLTRLSVVRDLVRGRQLASVILKLLGYCVKLKVNRQYLCNPSLNALNVLLGTLNQALQMEQESSGGGGAAMAEEVLGIMENILQEATSSPQSTQPPSEGDRTQLDMLLDKITSPFVRASTKVLQAMMRIIPFLTFGDEKNMKTLIIHFMPYLDFEKFDVERSSDETLFIDCFCKIANGIENNQSGARLKEMILENGIVDKAIKYLETHTPAKSFSKANLAELDIWKEFLARPSLPYVLRLLCGLCKGDDKIQRIIGETTIPVIHRLEQVSSEEKVGSLAENLQEALRENLEVEKKINEVRRQTRAEKKKLAMAMREKQLGALGMQTTGDKIIAKPSSLMREMEHLSEESGLACCICREGYNYSPQKVLGIYTFTKRCVVEDFETKQRKTQAYCTVSHFNVVHYDCHMAAVRLARGRDEWESAALQNANTKCNGLLPIWGPQVSESAFASCLARHNSYIQESTGHIEPNYYWGVHDLRLLLQRFAMEKSFSDDTGGGGKESNIHFIPYNVHMILYELNTTRQRSREEKNLQSFMEAAPDKWVDSSFKVESPYYFTLLSLFVYSLEQWLENRLTFLRRLVVTAHARHISPSGATRLQETTVQAYSVYKPALIYFCFVDQLQHIFKKSLKSSDEGWPQAMADNIRNTDDTLLKACDKLLKTYQNDLLPAESFAEFFDVAELLAEVENPDGFVTDALSAVSK